jgi:hypothetical protein
VFIHNAIGWMVEVGTSSKKEKCGSHSTRAVDGDASEMGIGEGRRGTRARWADGPG